MASRRLVLDANILIRSVLGARVRFSLDALEPTEVEARARMGVRDPEDWPTLAAALLLDCPIWTEDQDFFGSGVPTWTTATVDRYLSEP